MQYDTISPESNVVLYRNRFSDVGVTPWQELTGIHTVEQLRQHIESLGYVL